MEFLLDLLARWYKSVNVKFAASPFVVLPPLNKKEKPDDGATENKGNCNLTATVSYQSNQWCKTKGLRAPSFKPKFKT